MERVLEATIYIEAHKNQYTTKEFVIQGAKINAVFPVSCNSSGVMDTIREMLIHSYVANSGGSACAAAIK